MLDYVLMKAKDCERNYDRIFSNLHGTRWKGLAAALIILHLRLGKTKCPEAAEGNPFASARETPCFTVSVEIASSAVSQRSKPLGILLLFWTGPATPTASKMVLNPRGSMTEVPCQHTG